MFRDAAVTILQGRLGNRTDLADVIIAEMQLAQADELERHHWLPWFLETEYNVALARAPEGRLPLPLDFLAEIEDEDLAIRTPTETKWRPLKRVAADQATRDSANPSAPAAYTLSGENVILLPVVIDQDYQVSWKFYGRAETLDTNIENKWLKYCPSLVIAATGCKAALHIERPDLLTYYEGEKAKAWDTLYRLHIQREETNRDRVMEA